MLIISFEFDEFSPSLPPLPPPSFPIGKEVGGDP
jgi:hypothetical protein